MPGDPDRYRQRAISCANSAIACTSPAASQKFADLALVWLMIAVQLEEQGCVHLDSMGNVAPNQRRAT